MSFLKKDDVYAVYLDFNFLFLWGEPSKWFSEMIVVQSIDDLQHISIDFIEFLTRRRIVIEETYRYHIPTSD